MLIETAFILSKIIVPVMQETRLCN